MLSEAKPGVAEALVRWEALDDTIPRRHREEWAGEIMARAPNARARIRWGTVDEPESEPSEFSARLREAVAKLRPT